MTQEEPDEAGGLLRGVGHDAVWTYLPSLAGIVSSITITAFVSRHLGVQALGLYAVPLVVVGLLQTVDFALSTTVQRASAAAGGASEHGLDAEVSRSEAQGAQRLYVLSGLAAALVLVGLAGVIDHVTSVPHRLVGDMRVVCLLLGLQALVTLGTSAATGVLMGERWFKPVAVSNVIGQVTTLALAVLLVEQWGLPGLAIAQLVGTVVSRGLTVRLARVKVPWLRLRPALPSRNDIAAIRRVSGPVFVLSAAMQVMTTADLLVVAAEAGPLAAGQFRIGYVVATQASGLVFQGYDAVLPTLARSSHRAGRQVDAVRGLTRIWCYLSGIGYTLLALGSPGIVQALSGQHHRDGTLTLALLSGAWAVNITIHGFSLLLVARGDAGRLVTVLLVEVVANLALTVVLVEAVGGWGSALATLILAAVSSLVWLPWRLRDLVGGSVHRLVVTDGLVPLLLGAVPVVLVAAVTSPLDLGVEARAALLLVSAPLGVAAGVRWARPADREQLRAVVTRRPAAGQLAE